MLNIIGPKSSILCLIPLKNYHKAKSRLRLTWEKEFPESLITSLYKNTLEITRTVCDFGVVSPSQIILDNAKKLGAVFTYQDEGQDLNMSLKSAIDNLQSLNQWAAVCILMGDLPLLSKRELTKFVFQTTRNYSILPVHDVVANNRVGTSGLFIPLDQWSQINLHFGKNSFERFQKMFKRRKIPLNIFHSIIGRDLDVLEDFDYLFDYIHNVPFVQSLLAHIP